MRLPAMPMRVSFIHPGARMPINVGRPGSLAAVEAGLDTDGLMLLVGQKSQDVESPGPDDLQPIGVVVIIQDVQSIPGGRRVLIQGGQRVGVRRLDMDSYDCWVATVDPIEDPTPDVTALIAAMTPSMRANGVPEEVIAFQSEAAPLVVLGHATLNAAEQLGPDGLYALLELDAQARADRLTALWSTMSNGG